MIDKNKKLVEEDYTDSMGRKFRVMVPEGHKDLSQGIIIGPPFLDGLGLPLGIEIRLNNELFVRGLFTIDDVLRKGTEIEAALKSAMRVDVQTLIAAYRSDERGEG